MSRNSIVARLDRLEKQFSSSSEADQVKAEDSWWHALLFGGRIPRRPKTRHVTLEVIVAGSWT